MRHVLALLALVTTLTFGITAAPAQTPPSTTQPSSQPPIQPSTQPSPAPSTETTTPAQVPSSQPGTPQTPAPAQTQPATSQPSPPSETAPALSPSTQDTQAPAPAEVTTPQNQVQGTPSKELIDQQCYQGYGPSQAGTSASAPQILRAISAQGGGTPVTQVDVTQTTQTSVVPSSLCGGWAGAPAGRFPNTSMTPEFPIMSSGGIEMLPLQLAQQRWENFEGGSRSQ